MTQDDNSSGHLGSGIASLRLTDSGNEEPAFKTDSGHLS